MICRGRNWINGTNQIMTLPGLWQCTSCCWRLTCELNLHRQQIFMLCYGNTHNTVAMAGKFKLQWKTTIPSRRNFWRINCNLNCMYNLHVENFTKVWIIMKTNHTMEVWLLGCQKIWAPLLKSCHACYSIY